MSVFLSTLNQTTFLFGLIIIGYILVKCKVLPENSATVLSKLESTVFIPALVMGTFIENFTIERIYTAWKLLSVSFVIGIIAIAFAIFVSHTITKDTYIKKIYTYGLSFSNFGFMGNAVVSSLFPDIFFEYLIFTLPLWMLIYLWGVPKLLIADSGKKQTFKESFEIVCKSYVCSDVYRDYNRVVANSASQMDDFYHRCIGRLHVTHSDDFNGCGGFFYSA